ncbi:tetratricopeptide repeat protein [Flavobacterium cellulosilyticum]|uniref:Tetratricopeptide repeat protein n=1 Tax=Flavobacterium cellulosilyticum TaxID=2541731 RepID=A0A4V2Z039_9FLAO|nr:tetratricopeptide repeat protein [Flavobacterium cellulosilyticum]TDD99547.1 tetratricopeptide repeat protein [Flavobacterium cellulosilyticum]
MKKKALFFLFLVLLCNPALLLAQTEPEQIIPETDKFEDFFYESLLQKGIENYDKAIIALEQCLKLKPNDATVYFELGKNQFALKQYDKAYNSFEQATQIDPKNKWFWVGMYDVSSQTGDYNKAILTANKLIEFDQIYKEDLTSIYMNTQQYDKALSLINELNDKIGRSDRRDSFKRTILSQGKYQSAEIENLKEQINKYPKTESNYIALIKLYSENNEEQKTLEITQKLEEEIPSSEWAQVGLFKYYLDNNEAQKAINSMNIVLASTKMDSKIKHRILNEFLIFLNKNPQYESELEKAIAYFDKDPDVNVAKEIGKYYHNKQQWDKAIQYYELTLKNNSNDDVETQLLLLQAYVETKQFEIVVKKATSCIETFPLQPQFYYFSGLANNQMKQFKKAKNVLEMGMDYVIDNLPLEINFNIQLGEAYNGLDDSKKKELYFNKANQLLINKK